MSVQRGDDLEDSNPRSIALVDDHELVGLAVRATIDQQPDLQLLGSFPTVESLLASAVSPDLVLLDLRLGDGSAPIDNIQRIREVGADVLIVTSGEDAYLVREALRADVLGLVRKSAPLDGLVEAIRRAAHGRPVVTSEWAHAVENDPRLERAALSRQEEHVLRLFADGARAHTVAAELFITVGTLEDYVRRIRAKYLRVGRPAPTKVDLYKRAVEDGLLPRPGQE